MEALILSCGTGGGHNAAGYAVINTRAVEDICDFMEQ